MNRVIGLPFLLPHKSSVQLILGEVYIDAKTSSASCSHTCNQKTRLFSIPYIHVHLHPGGQ